jgi:hypothetical protein
MSNEQKGPQPDKPKPQSMGIWIAIGAAQNQQNKSK